MPQIFAVISTKRWSLFLYLLSPTGLVTCLSSYSKSSTHPLSADVLWTGLAACLLCSLFFCFPEVLTSTYRKLHLHFPKFLILPYTSRSPYHSPSLPCPSLVKLIILSYLKKHQGCLCLQGTENLTYYPFTKWILLCHIRRSELFSSVGLPAQWCHWEFSLPFSMGRGRCYWGVSAHWTYLRRFICKLNNRFRKYCNINV